MEPIKQVMPGDNWANKECQCCMCGTIETCSYDFDFYLPAQWKNTQLEGYLVCESCLHKITGIYPAEENF